MKSRFLSFLLLVCFLLAGCSESSSEPDASLSSETIGQTTSTSQRMVVEESITILRDYLEIFVEPKHNSTIKGRLEGCPSVVITEKKTVNLENGKTLDWGKLRDEKGWICLNDAKNTIQNPTFCSDCGITEYEDAYISRYGKCTPCHKTEFLRKNGPCAICKEGIDDEAVVNFDGKRCTTCAKCDRCGQYLSEDFKKTNSYYCVKCYLTKNNAKACPVCWEDAVISKNGKFSCLLCGSKKCNCGGPITEHSCQDYPNVTCPNCDWGIYTTGIGVDGVVCPECGTRCL